MSKKITNISFGNTISGIAKLSVFNRIISEIDASEVPSKYVQQILVQYHNGNIVELKGEELTQPIPVNKNASWEKMKESFDQMKDLKIVINTDILEKDINELVEKYLGHLC